MCHSKPKSHFVISQTPQNTLFPVLDCPFFLGSFCKKAPCSYCESKAKKKMWDYPTKNIKGTSLRNSLHLNITRDGEEVVF